MNAIEEGGAMLLTLRNILIHKMNWIMNKILIKMVVYIMTILAFRR